jgi:hypothetical protein
MTLRQSKIREHQCTMQFYGLNLFIQYNYKKKESLFAYHKAFQSQTVRSGQV